MEGGTVLWMCSSLDEALLTLTISLSKKHFAMGCSSGKEFMHKNTSIWCVTEAFISTQVKHKTSVF